MLSNNKFKRAAAMGSAASGSHHWSMQRMTAIALIPLVAWLIFSLARVLGAPAETIGTWLSSPVSAGMMIVCLIAGFYHAVLGLQVVIEDYVHHHALNIGSIMAIRLIGFVFCAIGIVSVIKLAV